MVLTVLEASVEADRVPHLLAAYRQAGAGELDQGLERSYLVRDTKEPNAWKILTFWRSAGDLQAMRASGETPRGVLIFQAAGATPSLSVHEVTESILA